MASRAVGDYERPRVLLIEDDADVRLFMMLALRAEGYEVTGAREAEEALRELAASDFDLVLTDYGLPGKDGVALIKEAENAGLLGRANVMMLTAFPWLALGRHVTMPVLPKPVDFDELRLRLRSLLEQTGHASLPAPH